MLGSVVAAAGLLLSPALAQVSFSVYTMQVMDMRIPYTQHNISFTVNAPNSTLEEGGDSFGGCSFGWGEGDFPTCWQECKSTASNTTASNPDTTYYARLEDFSSADQFNVSIWQSFDDHYNTGLISIRNGRDGYYCSAGAQTTQCSIGFPFTPIKVPTESGDSCEPTGWPLC